MRFCEPKPFQIDLVFDMASFQQLILDTTIPVCILRLGFYDYILAFDMEVIDMARRRWGYFGH